MKKKIEQIVRKNFQKQITYINVMYIKTYTRGKKKKNHNTITI